MTKQNTLFLVVQQGGSTRELYLHTFTRQREAAAHRRSADRATYATSNPVRVPVGVEQHLDAIQDIVDAAVALV